jgi:hypothetical protein
MSVQIGPVMQNDKKYGRGITQTGKESLDVTIVDEEALDLKGDLRDNPDGRESFLAEFSVKESRDIMSKVDKRFFILIGLMFLIKNVSKPALTICSLHNNTDIRWEQLDATNASNVKVLQVGQHRNILKELGMSADAYNWVGSIYGVCIPASTKSSIEHGLILVTTDCIHYF